MAPVAERAPRAWEGGIGTRVAIASQAGSSARASSAARRSIARVLWRQAGVQRRGGDVLKFPIRSLVALRR